MELKVGDEAPDWVGRDEEGKEISLAQFKGKKLVLYFYPKDNTPTCTVQACNLRDERQVLKDNGYEVVGVSADGERKHQNFINKFELNFPLVADTEKELIKAYGVWGWKKFMGREYEGIIRTTFVIDEQGMIEKIINKVKAKQHSEQILESEEA